MSGSERIDPLTNNVEEWASTTVGSILYIPQLRGGYRPTRLSPARSARFAIPSDVSSETGSLEADRRTSDGAAVPKRAERTTSRSLVGAQTAALTWSGGGYSYRWTPIVRQRTQMRPKPSAGCSRAKNQAEHCGAADTGSSLPAAALGLSTVVVTWLRRARKSRTSREA